MLTKPLSPIIGTMCLVSLLSSITGCANTTNVSHNTAPQKAKQTPSHSQAKPIQAQQTQTKHSNFAMQCRGRVFVPAKFRETIRRLQVFEGSPEFTNIPATIKWTNTRIQIEPARYPVETIPATYRTVTTEVPILRRRIEIVGKPAIYRTLSKPVVTNSAHRIWKKNCIATDPQQCLIDVPIQIRHVKQQIIDIPARMVQMATPAKTLKLKQKMLVSPGQGSGTPIPAQYKEVKVGRVEKPWQVIAKRQPPQFTEIPVQQIISPDTIRTTVTLCTDKTTPSEIRAIQRRLRQADYQAPLNGVLDSKTMHAVIKFQQDNHLSIGAITLETLGELGLLAQPSR